MGEWRDTFQRNWIYMVAAGLLSLLLWVAVNAGTVTQQIVVADLVVVNGDGRYVVMDTEPQTSTAEVLFTGRRADFLALSVARPRVVVLIDSVESRVQKVALAPRMVRGPDGGDLGDVRALQVLRPDTVRIQFEPRARKVVRVVPRVGISMADGYMVADSIRVKPGVVLVEGPESGVASVDSLSTAPVSREELRESLKVEVPIESPPARGLRLSASTVEVTVPVDVRAERLITRVPVRIVGSDRNEAGAFNLQPARVDLHLSGPERRLADLDPSTLVPRVALPEAVSEPTWARVSIGGLPPFVRGRVSPDSVRVSREASGTSTGAVSSALSVRR